jgi:succinyl-CoA synthetase beta subunit
VNLHEYQARERLRAAGIPVPDAEVAEAAGQVETIARRLAGPVVIKAQVHAGGRGKAGGVKLASNPREAGEAAGRILGMRIKGLPVSRVLVAPAAEIASESYVGIVMDRASQRPVIMVSPAGGVDIEDVAAQSPEKIFRAGIDPRFGLLPHQALGLAFRLYRDLAQVRRAADIMRRLYQAFLDAGASLAEINPLITTPVGDVLALDAKIVVDDNELERRPDVAALRDVSAEDPAEVRAREAGLSFIKLDGDVGCCVNGAGLAMATMDLVKYYGGEPANFLDIGGSSNPQKVVDALSIITADPSVKSILFNIFGGITRCDDVANGIVTATGRMQLRVPLVIRLTGTNEQQAMDILQRHGFTAGTDMDTAVQEAVKRARGVAA